MDANLSEIKTTIYDQCSLNIFNFQLEEESQKYNACQFNLNYLNIISRTAKITPKKIGQFVTFWKRKKHGIIEPFEEKDNIDFYVLNIRFENRFGQFVFPKSILIKKGIISTVKKEGKRAFRVYPNWDIITNKQAEKTQKWQLEYFYEVTNTIDIHKIKELYNAV